MKNILLPKLFILLVALSFVKNSNSQIVTINQTSNMSVSDSLQQVSDSLKLRENIIAQMNYCISTLTNIIHHKSIAVLNHESDQLINNLTIEQIVGLEEINDFRLDLAEAISKFEITEEERLLMKRIQSIKRDNLKWNALANALNPTMLLTGNSGPGMGYQIAFQALLTAARSVVEYQAMKGEQNIEELQAMWSLRKEDLKEINRTRTKAMDVLFKLYNKYKLNEFDRLTESTADLLSQYIAEANVEKRIRLLEDNYETYKNIVDYYYYLGMAYADNMQYEKAAPILNKYLLLYSIAPILRYNEKIGCIALTKLLNDKNLPTNEKEMLIQTALDNLPGNSAAVLQCAMTYLYELRNEEKALAILRKGIDDVRASDRDLLFMAATKWMSIIVKYPLIKNAICSAFENCKQISLDTYAAYLLKTTPNAWEKLNKLIKFNNIDDYHIYKPWESILNDELSIVLPPNITYNTKEVSCYFEYYNNSEIHINQLVTAYANSITLDDINDVDCFKSNKDLKYLFLENINSDETFVVKRNLDYVKIKKGEAHRMSEFILSESDIEDIIDFCKEHVSKVENVVLNNFPYDVSTENKSISSNKTLFFKGKSLLYTPQINEPNGYYFNIYFSNGIHLKWKFNQEKEILEPYIYWHDNEIVYGEAYKKLH